MGNKIVVHTEAAFGFHKEFPLSDRTLGLNRSSSGRYAYFREERFQSFLDDIGLDKVQHSNPNMEFEKQEIHSGWGNCSTQIWTDGNVQNDWHEDDSFVPDLGSESLYKGKSGYKITGATYAVIYESTNYRDSHSSAVTLYTEEKPYSLYGKLRKRLTKEGLKNLDKIITVKPLDICI